MNEKRVQASLQSIESKIRNSSKILVSGHQRPDGDCYGSLLGMHFILDWLQIEHQLFAGEQGRTGYDLFPGIELVKPNLDPAFDPDLYIFVDSATLGRILPDWNLPDGKSSINIDHHGSNSAYAELNWVDPSKASTAEMIFILAKTIGVPLTAELARALLLGLVTDTGSFRYSNVGAEQLEIAAELVRNGASVAEISQVAYESRSPEAVRVTAEVLSSIQYLAEGKLAWSEVRSPLVQRVGGPSHLPENLSAELRSIRGVSVALLFVELPDGGLRLSLRSDGSVNVSELASRFGGGGHPNAAGLTMNTGPYEAARDRILAAAEEAIVPDA